MVAVSNMNGGISFLFSPMCGIETWHCIYNTHVAFSFVSIRYGCLFLDWIIKGKHRVSLTGACVDAKMRKESLRHFWPK